MELFEGMSQRDQDQFRRVCGRLLTMCFISKQNEATRADYYFIERHRPVFERYLGVLGLSLEINDQYKIVQLVSREGLGHVNLRLSTSIILLILRILYDEKKRELSVTDVVVNVGDIQEKYMSMKVRDKQIDKTTMNNALHTLRRYNLVELLDHDLTQEDARILIYDSIVMAVRVDDIRTVSELIGKYRRGRQQADEEPEENPVD